MACSGVRAVATQQRTLSSAISVSSCCACIDCCSSRLCCQIKCCASILKGAVKRVSRLS